MDRNTLTLLAVLSLSVSNLFVGLVTQNRLLIIASSTISAALAFLYLLRERFPALRILRVPPAKQKMNADTPVRPRPFPLWVFLLVLFLILPALLWFLQMNTV